jgi:hypothetical protein
MAAAMWRLSEIMSFMPKEISQSSAGCHRPSNMISRLVLNEDADSEFGIRPMVAKPLGAHFVGKVALHLRAGGKSPEALVDGRVGACRVEVAGVMGLPMVVWCGLHLIPEEFV